LPETVTEGTVGAVVLTVGTAVLVAFAAAVWVGSLCKTAVWLPTADGATLLSLAPRFGATAKMPVVLVSRVRFGSGLKTICGSVEEPMALNRLLSSRSMPLRGVSDVALSLLAYCA